MRTSFTATQLADPDVRTSEKILRRCVHCGFCTATCPTYMLLGDELDSPRGRIYLIKEMLEKGGKPSAETVKHVDRCLSCLSCVTTCPSGVDYMHLVDHARDYVEKNYERAPAERLFRRMLGFVLSRPAWFRLSLHAARVAKPLAPLLPRSWRNALTLAPTKLASERHAAQQSRIFAAQGTRRGRVALLAGCAQRVVAPSINEAAIRFLTRQGIEVVLAGAAGCCGALTHHLGQTRASHDFAKANISAWHKEIESGGLDAIVTTTSGCGTMLKDYGHLFREDTTWAERARKIAALAKDITEYVASIGLAPAKRLRTRADA
jgi:glycolate oxidase iron-sulfur subunit